MKLYIDQLPGDGVSGRSFVIYNEAGERLPCITKASVHHGLDDVASLDISLVVDGYSIVFGKPPSVPIQGEKFSDEAIRKLIDQINDAVRDGAVLNIDRSAP